MNAKSIAIATVAAGITVAGAWWTLGGAPRPAAYHGWVEADLVFVGADEPGRLISLHVREGETIKAGVPLFELESDIQTAEWRQAKASLAEAQARLARSEAAQQRPEEVAVLLAQQDRAEASIEQSRPEFERASKLVQQGTSPQSRLDQAKATYERDVAVLKETRQQVEVARMQARAEDIRAAEEIVAQARARLASAEVRRQQRAISAPAAGVVQEVYYRPGEIVASGRPVIALLPPANIKVRFFVPQSELPRLAAGDRIEVTCDGCSSTLAARVSFISREAEFTPPVIFSREERAKLVYRIEAIPERPELLRVGQPIEVAAPQPKRVEAADARI